MVSTKQSKYQYTQKNQLYKLLKRLTAALEVLLTIFSCAIVMQLLLKAMIGHNFVRFGFYEIK
jgi:hypothetical protein